MAASLWGRVGEFLPISLCSCNHFRCAARLASRVTRPGPGKPVKQVKQVKTVKRSMDMKATLTRQLNRRKEMAVRRVSAASKPKAAAAEESISKGRREIIIEPSCQNPAFKAEDSKLQMTSFYSMGLRDDVLKGLESMAITKPTVTQMVSIPPILNREHVLCAAQTGTGKTLAYLLPIVHHLKEEQDKGVISRLKRPRALIVVPNRELAFQVLKVAKSLSHSTRFRSALLTGGRKLRVLKSGLELPVDLLVGTPGTLLEFRERGRLFFSDVSYLVIDEVDSMFDKTFKSETMDLLQTMSIRQDTPPSRTSLPVDTQVMIVGATLPSELVGTLQEMLPDIHTCTSSLHRVLPHVRHKFVKVQQHRKAETLLEILREDLEVADRRSVVFCNTTPSCDFLGHFLTDNGVSHIKLHSTVAIQERSNLFKEFQQEKSRILVCTDIASRGLDTDVDHVINFDFPLNVTDYIHRVGRTGRVRTGAKQREVADATSLMTHNRDVRIALIIEEAALTQRSVKSVEARMTKPAPSRREVLSSSKRPGRHVSSLQAILPRRRSRKPGQDKEETSRRKNKLMTDTNAASVA